MAVKSTPVFPQTPNIAATQITTGTGSSGIVTVYAGGSNGSKVAALIATTVNTTGTFDLQWGVSSGGTFYLLGTVAMPAGSGSTDSLPTINLLGNGNAPGITLDSDGNPFLFLASSNWSVQAKTPALSSAWATGSVFNIIAPAIGDF